MWQSENSEKLNQSKSRLCGKSSGKSRKYLPMTEQTDGRGGKLQDWFLYWLNNWFASPICRRQRSTGKGDDPLATNA